MSLLGPLDDEERATFLAVSLPQKPLLKLVGRLGTAPKGTRLDRLTVWDLAWSLVDYYERDAEVSEAVDLALRKELGDSPLAAAVAAEGGARAVESVVLESRDPLRDVAWALLLAGGDEAGAGAKRLVGSIVADFDAADEQAREEEARAEGDGDATAEAASPPDPDAELRRDAQKARVERDRARSRLENAKERLAELEGALGQARREAKAEEAERKRVEAERDRLAEEREALRARVSTGTAAEVARLGDELEGARRRARVLEEDLAEARRAEEALESRVRTLETARPARPKAEEDEETTADAGEGPGWSTPVFTDEFYESIRRWDRKIVKTAFEKVARLAEDWRHPSLRAIPLEGLPGAYRIRIATDVRLIYRPLDGSRVEILSLIDREDLQRYIRHAKGI